MLESKEIINTMTKDLICDIGMHTGNDTAFYLACGYNVLAVEADPDLVAGARLRFKKEIEEGRLIILNVAIAEQAGLTDFWINENRPALNSFNRELTARDGEPHHVTKVECKGLDQILSEYGPRPFYIKIDIEGHDLICCNQLSSSNKPAYISVEMSDEALLLRLRELGYNRFKFVNQMNLAEPPYLTIPIHQQVLRFFYWYANNGLENRNIVLRITREIASSLLKVASPFGLWSFHPKKFKSKFVPDWNFEKEIAGTYSGSFGKDLPGEWRTFEQSIQIWRRDVIEYQKLGWQLAYDLHATSSDAT